MDKTEVRIGFTGLDLTTGLDKATAGSIHFVVKDHPRNADKHILALGKLIKSQLILSIDNGKFTVSTKEYPDGNPE
jgi:hypothetical protein